MTDIDPVPAPLPSQSHLAPGDVKAGGLQIVFRNLAFSVVVGSKKERHEKVILKDITGVFRPGRFTAIMGASGAGKTSLLNVLAGEARTGNVSGQLLVNSEEVYGSGINKISGFVFQVRRGRAWSSGGGRAARRRVVCEGEGDPTSVSSSSEDLIGYSHAHEILTPPP
ncbi:hypothetical protein BDK51DRAFT_42556 [Blyttiomyces helicus]|uniref:ABC transporter domain-containing protein n=1 Tax=Blyttiomyces helicus TaxID=388810 RepID=A0A4P9WC71_9FUNG|nr:hypothetical protein BDK51DRAFT_42556 [Blyttiomyces helicus]|eukprot:RKO88480.1 hypothetical protein BDK51DRAFT_42556 [Blyttiomyces helicus]